MHLLLHLFTAVTFVNSQSIKQKYNFLMFSKTVKMNSNNFKTDLTDLINKKKLKHFIN